MRWNLKEAVSKSLVRRTEITYKARIAKLRGVDSTQIFIDMLQKKYVDAHMNIITENRNSFFADYPELVSGVKGGKVVDRNKKNTSTIKIRKAVYSELKELWE